MLSHLQIRDLAIVKALEVEWSVGMTAITGETGAGKSIAIDALSLTLGDRAEAAMVRPGSEKAEVIASFDISKQKEVLAWLKTNDLDNGNDCIIRRVISKEGRSAAYINGSKVPLQQIRQVSEQLVCIHGQHAHQLLTIPEHQQLLLDSYAKHDGLLNEVKSHYQHWRNLEKEYQQLALAQTQRDSQKQLLEYQVNELDEFGLQVGEFETIEQEHKTLSHGNELLSQSQYYLTALYEESEQNAYNIVNEAANNFAKLAAIDSQLQPISDMLFEAAVQIEEASFDIRHYCQSIELDPSRLAELENRITRAMSLARKHHVDSKNLAAHHNDLAATLSELKNQESRLDSLVEAIEQAKQKYHAKAEKLTISRTKAAKQLDKQITESIRSLNMPDGKFRAEITPQNSATPSPLGIDKINFLVSANPGQPLQPLAKVASGGELARISLAIQVIIANTSTTPTLVFDEVDVGISGPTAAAVAKLLRKLGETTQVICVTHLPQVASRGHQQLFVEKTIVKKQTETAIRQLNDSDRIDEIARLLGGTNITATTRANASELLHNESL